MAGLGTVDRTKSLYLTVAGGYIWNRKAEESDPNYAIQTYKNHKKEDVERKGAQYRDFTGMIENVIFKVHKEYGENINLHLDADGEKFIISASTNNRNSQDIMKMLLKADLSKEIYIKPYDFIDGEGKRAVGISFRQDGEKLKLRHDDAPQYEGEWTDKKLVKRYFEDLTEWFVAEVEENVCSQFENTPKEPTQKEEPTQEPEDSSIKKDVSEKEEEKAVEKTEPKLTPFKMKKALKVYIANEYGEDYSLPKLSNEEVEVWYTLSLKEEELPFPEDKVESKSDPVDTGEAEVPEGTIDSQLDALMG